MTAPLAGPDDPRSADASRAANWSPQVSRLVVARVPTGALNLNVEGRQLSGPLQGFGQLWQKTFQVRMDGVAVSPREVIQVWRQNFPRFHAAENRFYPSKAGIVPGEVVLINAQTPGGPISTGMLVLYADADAFTLMTPEGHPESGWVTFSAFEQAGVTIAQVQTLARANDPLYELAFLIAGSKLQESIWVNVLTNLANHYQVNPAIHVKKSRLDARRQWSKAGNVWKNAQVRTILYRVFVAPSARLRAKFRRVGK